MCAKRKKRLHWPENNVGFMRPIGDHVLEDTGQEIGVWLDRADGFRWAADIILRHGDSDVLERDARERAKAQGPSSFEATVERADKEVLERLACRSSGLGPVNWFGLSCAAGTLYRHYIELLLKLIVVLCQRLERKESSFPQTHDLKTLWDEAEGAFLGLRHGRGKERREDLDIAAQHIEWLSQHDPDSQAFRYPTPEGNSRDKALPVMEELAEHVVPLGNYLRQKAMGLWAVRDQQSDVESDMSANGPEFAP